jgi:S-(hydroxymethyl)glutathione dehydrogenase/alcohol dehydrogenase
VVVRVDASGLCHSDVALSNGELAGEFPVVLGHEGTGHVLDVGTAVRRVRAGDRVVLSAVPSCGHCWFCARAEPYLCACAGTLKRAPFLDGATAVRGASGLGTFSDVLVVDESAVVRVDTDLPAEELAVIGCAVLTGVGAVLNIAAVRAGDCVLVIGAGGIGLAAVQGARAAGAVPIIAIDPVEAARASAAGCGATHVFPPGQDAAAAVLELTGGRGADAVIECVGTSDSFTSAWSLTRAGGQIVLVGVGTGGDVNPIPLIDVVRSGRRVIGCVYGQASVHRDVPRYVRLAEAGALDLGRLVGRRVTLAEIPEFVRGPRSGAGRTVVVR